MPLVQALERLVDVHEHRGVAMRQHLRPGLRRADIKAALSPLGLVAPEELYELYEWHDGVDVLNAPDMFFAEEQFLPLNEAVQTFNEFLFYYKEFIEGVAWINLAQCFPFAFFEGDYATIYCDPTPAEGLQYPVIDIDGGVVVYENIERMTQTAAEWFVVGIYDTDAPVDDDLRYDIRKRLNPRIDYAAQPHLL